MSEHSKDRRAAGAPSGRESWVALSFVALIMMLIRLGSAIWRTQEGALDCSGLFRTLPDFIYQITYFHGYLAGLLAGGLLSWRYGYRPALALTLIAQGALLAGSQIPDLRVWGCLLGPLFGLTAGMVFPACFQALVTLFRPGRQALPLFLLVFLIPELSMYALTLYFFQGYEPIAPAAHVGFGFVLAALALAAGWKNPAWLSFDLPARPGPPPDFPVWLRTLKIDHVIGFLVLSWACVSAIASVIWLFLSQTGLGGAFLATDYYDQYTHLVIIMDCGRMALIPVLALVCWRGTGLVWAILVISLLALVGLTPLMGFSGPWPQAAAFGLGLCFIVVNYSCYLLLADRVSPGQAGMVVALALILLELTRYLIRDVVLTQGPPAGPCWLALASFLALVGAVGAAKALVEARAIRWP